MKIITSLTVLAILFLAIAQANAFNVTWSPETPEPGDKITVNLNAGENVSGVAIQVCIGDVCLIPKPMERVGEEYIHSFYVDETAEIHLNFTMEYADGNNTWDDSTYFKVEKTNDGRGTPGFEFVIAVSAAAAALLLARIKRTKN